MNSYNDFTVIVYMRYLTEENVYTNGQWTNGQKDVLYFKNVENYIYVTDNFLKNNHRGRLLVT